jgi:hypothetical protein
MGIDEIAQDKIDDAVPSAERDGGFRTKEGQGEEALSLPSGEYEGQNFRVCHLLSFPCYRPMRLDMATCLLSIRSMYMRPVAWFSHNHNATIRTQLQGTFWVMILLILRTE